MTKENVLRALKTLPEEFNVDDLFHKLYHDQKYEDSTDEVVEGRQMSWEKIQRVVKKLENKGYAIDTNVNGHKFIVCFTCDRPSLFKENIEAKYCGYCKTYHEE